MIVFFWNAIYCQTNTNFDNLPRWVKPILEKSEVANKHLILNEQNPFYLESDFTGDKIDDIALMCINKVDSTAGVLIINKGKNVVHVIGCGGQTVLGSNLSWVKRWFVYREKIAVNSGGKKKLTFKYPALELVYSDNTSMIIYWKKNKYKTFVCSVD